MVEISPIGTYVAQYDNSVKKLLVKQFANFMSQKALWANALTCIHCSFGNCFYSKSQSLYSELLGSSGSGLRAPLPPTPPLLPVTLLQPLWLLCVLQLNQAYIHLRAFPLASPTYTPSYFLLLVSHMSPWSV